MFREDRKIPAIKHCIISDLNLNSSRKVRKVYAKNAKKYPVFWCFAVFAISFAVFA